MCLCNLRATKFYAHMPMVLLVIAEGVACAGCKKNKKGPTLRTAVVAFTNTKFGRRFRALLEFSTPAPDIVLDAP